jgi:Tol biopolymer transport system component
MMLRTRLTSLLILLLAAGCRGDEPQMAFVSERGGTHEIRLLTRGGDDRPLASAGAGAGLFPIAFAPKDPSLLAVRVVDTRAGPEEQLMIVPMSGGEPRPIGPLAARARNASWSPDGKWIAFESSAQSFRDLYRMSVDGKHVRRLTDNREGNFEPEVSPDGKWIAFVSSRDGDAELYVIPARGGPARRLTAFHRDDWSPRWSPDGRRIAFLSNREGSDRIYVMNADGSGTERATGGPDLPPNARPDSAEQEMDPAWSSDGRLIAYTFRTRGGRSSIRVTDPASGTWRDLSDGKGKDWMPAWSPDGRQIAFSSERGGDMDLYRMTADGKRITRLTSARGADWLPRWVR